MGGMADLLLRRPTVARERHENGRSAIGVPRSMPMPPGPKSTLKGESGVDVIRGSTNIPLNANGHAHAKHLAGLLSGKVSEIYSSDLKRAHQTAEAISKTNPQAGPLVKTRGLRPWHLGELEGQPTKSVLDRINEYAVKYPDKKVPGRSKQSTEEGESFNSFSKRGLGTIQHLIGDYKEGLAKGRNPVIAVTTHYRDLRLLKSWYDQGMPSDLSVKAEDMIKHEPKDSPGTVHRLHQDGTGRFNLASMGDHELAAQKLPHGIYFIRHGETDWNG